MALIQWKQIDTRLLGNGQLTGSLELSGSITLNGTTLTSFAGLQEHPVIFSKTGSFQSTTNNLQVTGSLQIDLPTDKAFSIFSNSEKVFEVDDQGTLLIKTQSLSPTAKLGGLYLDSSYNLFLGQE